MSETIVWRCEEQDAGTRIDACLAAHTELSRSRIATLMAEGALTIDGRPERKPSLRVVPGQVLSLHVPEARAAEVIAQNIPLDILYQDGDVVIVNKPCGMVVHPAAGNEDGTLVNALLYHISDLSGVGGELRPGIVHRLDKDTSGLILVAKNDRAHAALSEQFKERTMEKHYRAVALGSFREDAGLIDAPIARRPLPSLLRYVGPEGKPSVTQWRVLEREEKLCKLELRPVTGRTHQLRVHCAYMGFPILGDPQYGSPESQALSRELGLESQMLCAKGLELAHPITGERMALESGMDVGCE